MPEAVMWGATWNHPQMDLLNYHETFMLIDIIVAVADQIGDGLLEGLLTPAHFTQMKSSEKDLLVLLDRLIELRWVEKIDDPEGWLLLDWHSKAALFKVGKPELATPNWGQRSYKLILEGQKRKAMNQAAKRARDAQEEFAKEFRLND